jgi:hypothetical protein
MTVPPRILPCHRCRRMHKLDLGLASSTIVRYSARLLRVCPVERPGRMKGVVVAAVDLADEVVVVVVQCLVQIGVVVGEVLLLGARMIGTSVSGTRVRRGAKEIRTSRTPATSDCSFRLYGARIMRTRSSCSRWTMIVNNLSSPRAGWMKRCLYDLCDSCASPIDSSGVGTKYLNRIAYGRRTKILKASVMRTGGMAVMESFQDVLMSVIAVRIIQSSSENGGEGRVAYRGKLTEDDQELHEDQADEQPVDNDVPLSTSALNPTDVDVE